MNAKKLLISLIAGVVGATIMGVSAMAEGESSVDTWDGTADTSWYDDETKTEYVLDSAEDFAGFAQLVNGGNSFKDKTVKLASSIDLDNINWEPIGTYTGTGDRTFSGTFDGQNNKIVNMTVENPDENARTRLGLFSYITDATIKNLVIENATVTASSSNARGAVLVMTASGTKNFFEEITIKDSEVNTTSTGESGYAAGVLGYVTSVDMKNITVDTLSLTVDAASNAYAAAIVPYIYQADSGTSSIDGFTIEDVTIIAEGATNYVGGVSGYIGKGNQNKVGIGITNGTVDGLTINSYATSASNVGGLIGESYKVDPQKVDNVDITDLVIEFNGSGSKVGGVIGWDQSVSYDTASKSGWYNDVQVAGTIEETTQSGSGSEVGGFVGVSHQYPKIYTNCSADVDVATGNRAGGFVGTPCTNGWANQTDLYTDCIASGDVTAPIAGGFVGCAWLNSGSNTTLKLVRVKALGAVNGTTHAGGLIGGAFGNGGCSNIVIIDSFAAENVSGPENNTAGVIGNGSMGSGKTVTLENVDYTGKPFNGINDSAVKVNVARVTFADGTSKSYTSVEEAVDAAFAFDNTDGETVIDLLGNELKLTKTYNSKGLVTFKNGTLDATGMNISDSVFRLDSAGESVAFDSVKIVREATEPVVFACYFVNVHTATSTATFTNCEIDVSDIGSFVCNLSGETSVTFDGCNITADGDVKLVQQGGVIIRNSTIDAPEADVIFHNHVASVIENSTVTSKAITMDVGTLSIEDGSYVKAQSVEISEYIDEGTVVAGVITVDSTSTLEADNLNHDLINVATTGTVISRADAIEVVFEEVTENVPEGEKLYDINLVGAKSETINRLNSVDLTFVLTQENGKNEFEIIASNEEIVINPVNNSEVRYEFHYNGKDGVTTDIDNIITIGQVKFTGYGKFDFAVDATVTTNVAHATTLDDNIVDTFVPNGDTETVVDGELVIDDAKIEDVVIVTPTRDLVINIDFPNTIVNNALAYQAMKVTVTGEDLEQALVIDLGTDSTHSDLAVYANKADAEVTVADVYTITINNLLTVNTAYTVTVEGAGYRTARYTVNMQETDKTLNFWNNVKDNTVEVEEGKESSAKNVTFLAGDIVKDSTINIYDLSAVVSYFGEVELNVAGTQNDYAKYDLNRDGKIDSKDVAYVLVSWNN